MRLAASIREKLYTHDRLIQLVRDTVWVEEDDDELLEHLESDKNRLRMELEELENGTHWVYWPDLCKSCSEARHAAMWKKEQV